MITAQNIGKTIGTAKILSDISISIQDGEFVAISGRSGSGKSTLLYILSTLDQPSAGELLIDKKDCSNWDDVELHAFRNKHVGFVFQFHYLLPELTTLENILMPARKHKQHIDLADRALDLMTKFGIADKVNHLPSQLSGGEQQRVSIARALVMQPRFIFADEPTGNLDTHNGDIVMEILQKAQRDDGATLVLVTHEPEYSKLADREIFLVDGKLDTQNSPGT